MIKISSKSKASILRVKPNRPATAITTPNSERAKINLQFIGSPWLVSSVTVMEAPLVQVSALPNGRVTTPAAAPARCASCCLDGSEWSCGARPIHQSSRGSIRSSDKQPGHLCTSCSHRHHSRDSCSWRGETVAPVEQAFPGNLDSEYVHRRVSRCPDRNSPLRQYRSCRPEFSRQPNPPRIYQAHRHENTQPNVREPPSIAGR